MSAFDLAAVLALAAACAVWGLVQLWVARRDPGNPGVARECDGGCLTCASRGDDDCPRP
jgi:hypothetical protein